ANPTKLRKPCFYSPVVVIKFEEMLRFLGDDGTGVSSHVLDPILLKPVLDLINSVSVFFRMLILIPQPCLKSGGLAFPVAQNRIEWNPSITRQARNSTTQAMRNPGKAVVESEDDNPSRSRKLRNPGK